VTQSKTWALKKSPASSVSWQMTQLGPSETVAISQAPVVCVAPADVHKLAGVAIVNPNFLGGGVAVVVEDGAAEAVAIDIVEHGGASHARHDLLSVLGRWPG
jgi:hypothetical protein